MKKNIDYITIDGRGEHETFRDCITQKMKELKTGQGIHVIKDFEPFPMYKMMEEKGFDHLVEKISDEEYHVYFTPKEKLKKIPMGAHLNLEDSKIEKIVNIKLRYLNGVISREDAKRELAECCDKITAQEFAICEQYLQEYGISDEELAERMDEILDIFGDLLEGNMLKLAPGHPIQTYMDEVEAIRKLISEMTDKLQQKFIKNEWMELYDKLEEINIHFSRKQNQLFSALERKGFDKPSKVMWTLDNQIRDMIKTARNYLISDQDEAFLKLQDELIQMIEDMMVKETEILFATSMELLSYEDFVQMRKGDDEIGYCLIDNPKAFGPFSQQEEKKENEMDFLSELTNLLQKYSMVPPSSKDEQLEVTQGKLTLEQINLIFKHLPVDLSYVDENDIVKFYSDTKHRVFPRSKGVIGREVRNCHPRESVSTVEEIIRAFRTGEQDKAEFWLEMGDKFIYIIYNAVRDEQGNFKGVLEMMQDVTKIRTLSGTQRLLSWNDNKKEESVVNSTQHENPYNITEDTIIGQLVKEYPFIKNFLIGLSPKFNKLKNPVLFKTMSSMATIKMISERGDIPVTEFIDKIVQEIDNKTKIQ
ncbi:PAS domain-containing protein [Anaeromicropila herbilytica]|uniref:Histidine kinase n=1 Tax=Anaeromicropila herbilytica TaxID=2785025 RepID=A0A7R7EMP3_9FIRM|nr:PAS domain-containing protein [Anaeromicropila herbilytica]BCN31632.1 hypothetical protein bsdtb5_29270 [Anaeromicropila herbilytica]